MLRTKIVCTLGPTSDDEATIRAFVEAGMAVARINFSHGAYEEHTHRIEVVRRVASELGRPVAILADLQGPNYASAPCLRRVCPSPRGQPSPWSTKPPPPTRTLSRCPTRR